MFIHISVLCGKIPQPSHFLFRVPCSGSSHTPTLFEVCDNRKYVGFFFLLYGLKCFFCPLNSSKTIIIVMTRHPQKINISYSAQPFENNHLQVYNSIRPTGKSVTISTHIQSHYSLRCVWSGNEKEVFAASMSNKSFRDLILPLEAERQPDN